MLWWRDRLLRLPLSRQECMLCGIIVQQCRYCLVLHLHRTPSAMPCDMQHVTCVRMSFHHTLCCASQEDGEEQEEEDTGPGPGSNGEPGRGTAFGHLKGGCSSSPSGV